MVKRVQCKGSDLMKAFTLENVFGDSDTNTGHQYSANLQLYFVFL